MVRVDSSDLHRSVALLYIGSFMCTEKLRACGKPLGWEFADNIHMKLPYTESNHWSIEVSIVYSDR